MSNVLTELIAQADFDILDEIKTQIETREEELQTIQVVAEQFCIKSGWKWQWYEHKNTVYFCVRDNTGYREFRGRHKDYRVASNAAARKLCRYYQIIPVKRPRDDDNEEKVLQKCLDVELESIKVYNNALRELLATGQPVEKARKIADAREQEYLREHLDLFLTISHLE